MISILHLVRKSAFETSDFKQCLTTLGEDDQLVLIDDGCYNLQHSLIHEVNSDVMVIQSHAQARAIQPSTKVKFITMDDLIGLTFKYNSVITWQ